MFPISALNGSSSSEDESTYTHATQTKEAKEAEAFAAYTKALSYQQSGSRDYAEKLFCNLFDHPFLKEAASLIENDDSPASAPSHPGLQLLYSVHKNLAAILLERKELKQAMASYIEAVKIDSSEVTVWFKMGQIALKIYNYPLAKICFQQALQCNPNHWPSLDNAITVTFALGDYLMCLEHISCALEKDCYYTKGLVLRRQILSEQPSLESITKEMFVYCDPQIHTIVVDKEESKECLEESNKIRTKRRQLIEEENEKGRKPMTFLKPLAPFTWKNVGERLLELYEFATSSDPPKSLGLEVDLRDYNFLDQSLIFGSAEVEDDEKNQKTRRPSLRTVEEVHSNECPRQGSPFQRAQEQGRAMLTTTPESVKLNDDAKEQALLQRLKGDRGASFPVTPSVGLNEAQGSKKETPNPAKASSSSFLTDFEDMDVGDTFGEMPPLEDAMDISDLNLTDIQKTEFTPDLFLKTGNDDLQVSSDAKSLENVLSAVMDMEFGQEPHQAESGVSCPEKSAHDTDQEDPIPSVDYLASRSKCKSNSGSQVKKSQADPSVTVQLQVSPVQSLPSVLLPPCPKPHQEVVQAENTSIVTPHHRPHHQLSLSSSFPAHVSQKSTVSASAVSLPPQESSSTAELVGMSTPEVISSQDLKSLNAVQLRSSILGRHHSPICASLMSPQNTQETQSSLYLSVFTSPSKDGRAPDTSFYSTPISSFTKHLGESKSDSIVGGAHYSNTSKLNPQEPSSESLFKPGSGDPRVSKHNMPAVSKSPGVSAPHQVVKSVSSAGRLKSLSTGDLIEDVVRRQIMGPSSDQAHQSSLSFQKDTLPPQALSQFSQNTSGNLSSKGRHTSTLPLEVISCQEHSSKPVCNPSTQKPHYPQMPSPKSSNIMAVPMSYCFQESTPKPTDMSPSPTSLFAKKSPPRSKEIISPVKSHLPENLSKSPNKSASLSSSDASTFYKANPLLKHSMSMDAPTNYPLRKEGALRDTSVGSVTVPVHHLNTLSVLEAQTLLNASLSSSPMARSHGAISQLPQEQGADLPLVRPLSWRPHLARSSSLPGYLTSTNASQLISSQVLTSNPHSLHMWRGSSATSSHQPTYCLPSLAEFYPPPSFPPYILQSDSSVPSSAFLPEAAKKPISLLQGLSPPGFSNPFIPTMRSALSSFSFSSRSRSDERKSPVHSPRSPVAAPWVTPSQNVRKSPSHRSNSPKHQQRLSPSHQIVSGTQASLGSYNDNFFPGDHNYHQRGDLAMGKSGNTCQPQQKSPSQSHSSPGSQKKSGGAKRGPKRKSEVASLPEEYAQAYKRRSTRSRSSRSKKEVETPDFGKIMKGYFPQSLAVLEAEDVEQERAKDHMQISNIDVDVAEKPSNADLFPTVTELKDTEENDVKLYVKSCLRGHGLLELIRVYLVRLGDKSDQKWYTGLNDIYIQLYDCLRKHLTIPTIWFGDAGDIGPCRLREYGIMMLTKAELHLSKVVSERGGLVSASPSKTPVSSGLQLADLFGEFHKIDMNFLESLTDREDVFNQDSLILSQFCARLYWLQARQNQVVGQTLAAVDWFQMVQSVLEDCRGKDREKGLVVALPNSVADGVISLKEVSQMMDSVQRSRSLEDTRNLYDLGDYHQVVQNLMTTFNNSSFSKKSSMCKERPSQLLLLLDSLVKLDRVSEVMQWGEVCLHEAVLHFQRAPSLQLRQDWAATLVSLFETLDRVMDAEKEILKFLSHRRLVRLAHNLVLVIQIILDVADTVTEMPIASVRPWKILYRVLHYEESCLANSKQQSGSLTRDDKMDTDQTEEGVISPSLVMLIKSHEYLGRHSWCTKENGLLLTFMMSMLGKELSAKEDDEDDDDEDASSAFEQCVYCLYNHPNKRGRASRHLSDHNASPVEMTWEGAGPVFHFFAPHTIPEFDSYKASTVSSDVEHLLRRIYNLIPKSLQPGPRHTAVVEYIEGISKALPAASSPLSPVSSPRGSTSASSHPTDPYQICSLLYYLLGDFYFKNKEPAKAIKFYQLDLALSPGRLDSWAGLALSRMSQLAQKLNSTDLKIETPLYKKSEPALQCFRHAVELQDNSRKLWLEFGSLAYQLHSHASRQIHYKNMISMSEEMLQASQLRRSDMLSQAKNSYSRASECEGDGSEDDWLTHYMMGKVAEKQGDPPSIFLDCYKQAALCLHEEEAVYPSKLQFTTLPPHLALEALEVFFRTQASSLKLVLSGCDYTSLLVLDIFVTEALNGHFARREEKKQLQATDADKPETPSVSSSKSVVSSSTTTVQSNKKSNQACHTQTEAEERKDQYQKTHIWLEDMEASSDWSQGEISGQARSTGDMASWSSSQTASLQVLEISSPSASQVVNLPESPIVHNSGVQKQAGEDLDVVEGMEGETPMGCDVDPTRKAKCVEIEQQMHTDDSERTTVKSIAKETDSVGENTFPKPDDIVAVDAVNAAEGNIAQEGNKSDSDDVQLRNIIQEGQKSDSDDVQSRNVGQGHKFDSDNVQPRSIAQERQKVDIDDVQLRNAAQEGQKSDSVLVQKQLPQRCESTGFAVAADKSLDKCGTSVSRSYEQAQFSDSLEENGVKKHIDTPSIIASNEKDLQSVQGIRNVIENEVTNGDDPKEDDKTVKTNTVSQQDKVKVMEKWEIEDKEKPTPNATIETQDIAQASSSLPTLVSGDSETHSIIKEGNSTVSEADVEKLRSDVRQKCMAGLELCAARFSCHYKSLYRLAHAYFVMKEYEKARDLLLGCPNWQQEAHMPAPGLFSERKQNNFFQGLWKIPIEDIDRSGSFASHVHRSVRLLLDVLVEQDDLEMLLHIRNQLKKTPDAGKKYLRDSERLVLSEQAYLKCLCLVEKAMKKSDGWSDERKEENLLTAYRIWNLDKGSEQALRTLHTAFKVKLRGQTDVNRLTPEQAKIYCIQNLSTLLTPATPQGQAAQKSAAERNKPGQSTPVLNLEKQEKEKSQQTMPETAKGDRSTDKKDAQDEAQKCDSQTMLVSSHPISSSASTTAATTSIPTVITPAGQKDEDVIIKDEHE
ncbi:calcineurin-binding protein cabin-1-like [Plakobranchus ocellatus]|uniref:Calcineurin-binding protein cabin-1-like n=1 Tax=Plakobranchus ocellatus TaxID=259542 RepID=A0AAV3Y4U1_9GAST|nr:calcineurin-binding protein cabin-1-like [Plakobranchus ocellatus]